MKVFTKNFERKLKSSINNPNQNRVFFDQLVQKMIKIVLNYPFKVGITVRSGTSDKLLQGRPDHSGHLLTHIGHLNAQIEQTERVVNQLMLLAHFEMLTQTGIDHRVYFSQSLQVIPEGIAPVQVIRQVSMVEIVEQAERGAQLQNESLVHEMRRALVQVRAAVHDLQEEVLVEDGGDARAQTRHGEHELLVVDVAEQG